MINAREAWEATEKVNTVKHELKNIELLIENSINAGYYTCSVYTINGDTLNEKTVGTLIGLGYIIEETIIKEDTHQYKIKWLKPEEEEEQKAYD